jgi:hypothetical protein
MTIYLRFRDLKIRGIVNNWPTLKNRVKKHGFPPGRLIGPNTRAWTDEEINAYIASCPTAPKPAPVVKGRRGRPRKADRAEAEA